MRIVLAGASGFLGTSLRRQLAGNGHDLVQLVRRAPTGPGQVRWDPARQQLDPTALADADAVVNLAGAGVGDRRWTAAYMRLLRSSRVDSTATVATALAALPPTERPRVLLNASAVGFYGDTGDQAVDEASPAGVGFFPQLCQAWEAATGPAAQAGVRVVRLRTGLVLDRRGGLLKPLLLPTRLGLGGRLGDGQQWQPWISLADWLAAVRFMLVADTVAGPVNLVGPAPVRNAELAKALAQAMHRPSWAVVPRFALRLLIGRFADEAVASQRALPAVLTRAGYTFRHPDLTSAIDAALRADA